MRARLLTVAVVLVLASSLALAGGDPINNSKPPDANYNGSGVVITWESTDESGVIRYEISRGSGSEGTDAGAQAMNRTFVIGSHPAKGSNQTYTFVDQTALRTTNGLYVYGVYAVYGDGSMSTVHLSRQVIVSTSSVRRTWGSIKAMFR